MNDDLQKFYAGLEKREIVGGPKDGAQELVRHGELRCDFCLQEGVKWGYPTGYMRIDLGGPITHSDDDWAACEACHDLIEAEDWDKLIGRSIMSQLSLRELKPADLPNAELNRMIAVMENHIGRWRHSRTGGPYPEEEHE